MQKCELRTASRIVSCGKNTIQLLWTSFADLPASDAYSVNNKTGCERLLLLFFLITFRFQLFYFAFFSSSFLSFSPLLQLISPRKFFLIYLHFYFIVLFLSPHFFFFLPSFLFQWHFWLPLSTSPTSLHGSTFISPLAISFPLLHYILPLLLLSRWSLFFLLLLLVLFFRDTTLQELPVFKKLL